MDADKLKSAAVSLKVLTLAVGQSDTTVISWTGQAFIRDVNVFLTNFGWTDNTYVDDAPQMRRAYEQIRDAKICVNTVMRRFGGGDPTMGIGGGLGQAESELESGFMNYFMALGFSPKLEDIHKEG